MTEVRDELGGEPADENICVYINSKMESFCTDLIFPFGIPANGIISVFVGEFSALYLREGHEWTESADNVSKQKLVVLCRPYQGKPTCVPVPHVLPNEGESDLEESQEDTVLSQDIMEAVCKERKSTSDRMVISGAHLKLPSTELGLPNIEPDENDRSSAVDLEEFTVGSPVPSVDDADVPRSPVEPELPHIIDRSAPGFHLFSSLEESEDESPCVKKRRNCLRRAAAVPSSAKSSIDEPVSDDDGDGFLCGICKKSFRTRKSCQHHVWSHLNPVDSAKLFKCPTCTKAFSTSWAQKYHYKMKHVGARHMCSQCHATFESDVALSLHHRRTHTSCAKIHTSSLFPLFQLHHIVKRGTHSAPTKHAPRGQDVSLHHVLAPDPVVMKLCDGKCYSRIELTDIKDYLVGGTSFATTDKLKAYKSMDAHNYVTSGWVQQHRVKNLGYGRCVVVGYMTGSSCLVLGRIIFVAMVVSLQEFFVWKSFTIC
ncbi:hypothetical protein HPB51_027947 [Rhipicephalus microplus]|uniref:C2H2-type domain-containing protein n=1 Tax=Rhipicephalus microplus TaxID=6941 RepID=A0A9J6CYV6_RHIMP|nr:hypothetical protein HPB51_027947 [Rhipicephalus microplus]